MRLIDADNLIDELAREPMNTRTYSRANEVVLDAPTVEAIPLDEVKQARINIIQSLYTEGMFIDRPRILGILNRLIESEG